MLAAVSACGGPAREPLVTYFNGDFGLSLRYPASWRTEQAQQGEIWYRYFLGPAGAGGKPALSVTLLAGPLRGTLDAYAQSYLESHTPGSSREETRGPSRGRSYRYASADGKTRYALLLLEEKGRVFGLYSQGDPAAFEAARGLLDEIALSLTLERVESYPETRDDKLRFSVRLPPSWKQTRRFAGGGTELFQFTSPPLAVDNDGQTVHASLTLTLEPTPASGGAQAYYDAARLKLGEAFKVVSHEPWRTGFVDLMIVETPISASRIKRFYDAIGNRGVSLTFEARADVFGRVSRWCDLIASTFEAREPSK